MKHTVIVDESDFIVTHQATPPVLLIKYFSPSITEGSLRTYSLYANDGQCFSFL